MGGSLLGGFVQGFVAGGGTKWKTAREKRRRDLQDKILQSRSDELDSRTRARNRGVEVNPLDEKIREHNYNSAVASERRAQELHDERRGTTGTDASSMAPDVPRPPGTNPGGGGDDGEDEAALDNGASGTDEAGFEGAWGGEDYNQADRKSFSHGGAVAPRRRSALKVRSYADGGSVDVEHRADPRDAEDIDPNDAEDATDEADYRQQDFGADYRQQDFEDAVSHSHATPRDYSGDDVEVGATRRRTAIPTRAPRGRSPSQSVSAAKTVENKASATEYQKVRDMMRDKYPDMSENALTQASYAHVWKFYNDRGEPEKAQRAVRQLHDQNNQQVTQWMHVAKAAAEDGNVDATMKSLLRANGFVGNGTDIKLGKGADGKIAVMYIDSHTGKLEKQDLMAPEEILKAVTSGRIASSMELLDRAGYPRPTPEKIVPDKTRNNADVAEDSKGISDVMNAVDPDTKKPANLGNFDPTMKKGAIHTAGQIKTENDMLPEDAITTLRAMMPFKGNNVKIDRTNAGGAVVTLDGGRGRTVNLSKQAFDNVVSLQGLERIRQEKEADARNKAAEIATQDAADRAVQRSEIVNTAGHQRARSARQAIRTHVDNLPE